MKKVLTICLALIMVMSTSLTVFAAPGGFVSSPSSHSAPTLDSATNESEDCTGKVVITSYADRNSMPDDARTEFEKAYDEVAGTSDVTQLNSDLASLASEKNIPGTDLAVSDLFDLRCEGCEFHEDHGKFDIVLSADALENFFGLMRFDGEKWELIKDAKAYLADGVWHLSFSSKELSTFAIVVNTGATVNAGDGSIKNGNTTSPQTGDNSGIAFYVIITSAAALALCLVWRKYKKQSV